MDGARRHVALMVVPLAVIAIGVFAAVLVPYGWPIRWMTVVTPLEDPSPLLLVHVAAGILAVALALAVRRDVAPGVLVIAVALLSTLGMDAMTAIAVKAAADGDAWAFVLGFTAPVAVSLVIAFHALRAPPWDRALLLVGAFAIAALPYGCPLVPGMYNLFSGGIVFLLAEATLLVLVVRGLTRR